MRDTAFPCQTRKQPSPVFIIRKRLPILDLCLHARAEIIVDRADHVDLVVADLVNVRQRILIYRVDERYRKLIPSFTRKRAYSAFVSPFLRTR